MSFTRAVVLVVSALFLVACDSDDDPVIEAPAPFTIVDAAIADGGFTTLVAALQATDLVGTLSDTSAEFTVFAPTDDAFAALPAGTLEALLADTDTLTKILTYHVVPGKVMAADVVGLNG